MHLLTVAKVQQTMKTANTDEELAFKQKEKVPKKTDNSGEGCLREPNTGLSGI